MFILSVFSASRKHPCMLPLSSSFGPAALLVKPLRAFCALVVSASFVKRSEMDLSCSSGGKVMCTSGSRQRGSCRPSTEAGASTRTGTS